MDAKKWTLTLATVLALGACDAKHELDARDVTRALRNDVEVEQQRTARDLDRTRVHVVATADALGNPAARAVAQARANAAAEQVAAEREDAPHAPTP